MYIPIRTRSKIKEQVYIYMPFKKQLSSSLQPAKRRSRCHRKEEGREKNRLQEKKEQLNIRTSGNHESAAATKAANRVELVRNSHLRTKELDCRHRRKSIRNNASCFVYSVGRRLELHARTYTCMCVHDGDDEQQHGTHTV